MWVTGKCNLTCTYCYEKKKNAFPMTMDIAKQTIKFVLDFFKQSNDDILLIQFHGGEPLLEYDLIQYIVDRFEEAFRDTSNQVFLGTTTNGTLLNDERIEYLIDRLKYDFSLSIDGDKEINDLNRKFANGEGTYDTILPRYLQVLNKKKDVRLRMTYTHSTVGHLYNSIKHLVELGFVNIVSAPDLADKNWESEDMEVLYEQMCMIYNYVKEKKQDNDTISVSLVEDARFNKGECYGGIKSINIDQFGNLYPCSYAVGEEEYIIGNVNTGIDKTQLKEILAHNKIINEQCKGCTNYKCCDSSRCKIINKIIGGDYDTPLPIVCGIQNTINRFLEEQDK